MIKIYSWNVNGIRAVIKKGLWEPFLAAEKPDILCLQETRAKPEQVGLELPGYHQYWHSADKAGYSGTAIFSKAEPIQVATGFPNDIIEQYDLTGDVYGDPNREGRVIAAEFTDFWVVTVYTPNAKDDLSRIPLRMAAWDPAFLAYCKQLEQGGDVPADANRAASVPKPVVFCGDLNVAHTPDDLANPKPNVGKKGFTDEERGGFQAFVDGGFLDTFRMFTQGNGHYSWWSNFAKARERNVGWRIDYFMVSQALKDKVTAASIHADVLGSDHCPVSVVLDV